MCVKTCYLIRGLSHRNADEEVIVRGDKLVIEEEHASVARQIAELVKDPIKESAGKYIITIAGESGSGKTEIATVLAETLTPLGKKILSKFFLRCPQKILQPHLDKTVY